MVPCLERIASRVLRAFGYLALQRENGNSQSCLAQQGSYAS